MLLTLKLVKKVTLCERSQYLLYFTILWCRYLIFTFLSGPIYYLIVKPKLNRVVWQGPGPTHQNCNQHKSQIFCWDSSNSFLVCFNGSFFTLFLELEVFFSSFFNYFLVRLEIEITFLLWLGDVKSFLDFLKLKVKRKLCFKSTYSSLNIILTVLIEVDYFETGVLIPL